MALTISLSWKGDKKKVYNSTQHNGGKHFLEHYTISLAAEEYFIKESSDWYLRAHLLHPPQFLVGETESWKDKSWPSFQLLWFTLQMLVKREEWKKKKKKDIKGSYLGERERS